MKKAIRILRYEWPLHFVLVFTNWLPDNLIFLRFRGFLASFFFKKCGMDLRLGRNTSFYNPSRIVIGNHVYVAYGNWLCAGEVITIEDEVMIGPMNVIVSGNHTTEHGSFRYGKETFAPIIIGKGSWIASHCVITSGSKIGNGCLIAAHSVVKGELKDFGHYSGIPAQWVKSLV
jgi:acetyltransferase-like isoleucine patch superfamily enzyme